MGNPGPSLQTRAHPQRGQGLKWRLERGLLSHLLRLRLGQQTGHERCSRHDLDQSLDPSLGPSGRILRMARSTMVFRWSMSTVSQSWMVMLMVPLTSELEQLEATRRPRQERNCVLVVRVRWTPGCMYISSLFPGIWHMLQMIIISDSLMQVEVRRACQYVRTRASAVTFRLAQPTSLTGI